MDAQAVRRAEHAFADTVALWLVESSYRASDVIAGATDALVAGLDSPSLRELAGAFPTDPRERLLGLAEATLAELGLAMPMMSDAVQIRAAQVMCRRFIEDPTRPRELASWAHSVIGHQGAELLQDLVDLDDKYGLIVGEGPVPDLDAELVHQVRLILSYSTPG